MPRPFKRKRTKHDEVRDQRRDARGEQARQNVKRRKVENHDFTNSGQDLGKGGTVDSGNDDSAFYGFLTEDEQAYYANVNNKISANDFESDEERENFVSAVYRESQGRELKLASSQSCSRYLERLMLVSTAGQLLALFGILSEGLTNLAQHRFGSHVLETLFSESAKHVEVRSTKKGDNDETAAGLEASFVQATTDLEINMGYLLTDRFGSHVIRNLVLVLSGEPLKDPDTQKVLASKKKERLDRQAAGNSQTGVPREVPDAFKTALSHLIKAAVSSLDSTHLRALATHPTGNPVLQVLLKLELTNSDKGRSLGEDSLFHKLFSLDSLADGSEGTKLVSGLTYDSAGSHLVELVVQYAPGKVFKKLYKHVWAPRMASMAKNDVASYVVVKILQRLGKDDLADARDVLVQELPALLERRRFIVLQTLVERCAVRNADLNPIADTMKVELGSEPTVVLQRLLRLEVQAATKSGPDSPQDSPEPLRADTHGSLLVQSLLQAPNVSTVVQDSLIAASPDLVINMAKDPSASRVLQIALTSSASSSAFRKQLIPKLYNHLADLATNLSGSYLVEALWDGTNGLHFIKERLARELADHESELRESLYGRNVWRNWMMDLYSRRRAEWQARTKDQQNGDDVVEQVQPKSAIQLARERYAQGRTNTAHRAQSGDSPIARLKANG